MPHTIAIPAKPRPLLPRIGRQVRLRAMGLHEWAMDARLGIRATAAQVRIDAQARNMPYEAMSYLALDRIARDLALGPADVVYDIGCGMGRVTCYFARMPIKGSYGVELDPSLARIGQANVDRLRGRKAPAAVYAADAAEHAYPGASVIFLFNPFGADVMRTVLARIAQERGERRIRIVYGYPLHAAVLDAQPWLKPCGEPFLVPHYGTQMQIRTWESI